MKKRLNIAASLPVDRERATLIGRVWLPSASGPVVVRIHDDAVFDLSGVAPTLSQLLDSPDAIGSIRRAATLPRLAALSDTLANSACDARDGSAPWFLAPCDLQALKASGVTFVSSMLERVIEEQARGDASKAEAIRASIVAVIGDNLSSIRPGSPEAARLKEALIEQGAWSQYLEVGIGPDAEIFTKSQPMSAVGIGAEIGIHPKSEWNNPEPEIVLAVDSQRQHASARRSATTSTCAISKAAARCCWARRRTTTRRARSDRSSGCSTSISRSTMCAAASWRCASTAPRASN